MQIKQVLSHLRIRFWDEVIGLQKGKKILEWISEKIEMPRNVVAGSPQAVIDGFREVTIDMQKGLMSYSQKEIVVAVSLGCVAVSGENLRIRVMKEGAISIVGDIEQVSLKRTDML